MARTFADDDLARAGFEERGGSRPPPRRGCVLIAVLRLVLDHVGFQEHALAGNGWTKELQAAIDEVR